MINHIAIIMDGNGRWAKAKSLPVSAGHKKGAQTCKSIVIYAAKNNIKYLTIYAFSAENWQRPKDEVGFIMQLVKYYLDNMVSEIHKNNIKIKVFGDLSLLDPEVKQGIINAENLTKDNTGLQLNIALSYGSRQEIVNACKVIGDKLQNNLLQLEQIDEKLFETCLYSAGIPDPELLIRTAGDMRISNFLLWQVAYSELFFVNKYWPDFTEDDLEECIKQYGTRERRFGTRLETI